MKVKGKRQDKRKGNMWRKGKEGKCKEKERETEYVDKRKRINRKKGKEGRDCKRKGKRMNLRKRNEKGWKGGGNVRGNEKGEGEQKKNVNIMKCKRKR